MSNLHKRLINKNIPHGLSSKPPPLPNSQNSINLPGKKKMSFSPILWNTYFDLKEDITINEDVFRIYRRGKEGPVLFFLHGGGFSALSWALLSKAITETVTCQCLAMDIRGHGDTKTKNDENLSMDQMSHDTVSLIKTLYPDDLPPIVLVGHSMGGALAAHIASMESLPELAGLVVIDVVEGTALDALYSMQSFLRSRPSIFKSLEHAIEWSVKSCQIRNATSARVSFPGQLKNSTTGETATSELDRLPLSAFQSSDVGTSQKTYKSSEKRPTDIIEEVEEEEEDNGSNSKPTTKPSAAVQTPTFKGPIPPSPSPNFASSSTYTWRIDLTKTEEFWPSWFKGLSKKFLSFPGPKLLLLADVDRLDKDLTVGQMQGKFQINVLPKSGHAIHEDIPENVADCLATYLVRNKMTSAKADFDKTYKLLLLADVDRLDKDLTVGQMQGLLVKILVDILFILNQKDIGAEGCSGQTGFAYSKELLQ